MECTGKRAVKELAEENEDAVCIIQMKIIEEVRMKNDIVDVISDYVKLQKKGSSYFGLCPFHNEKSPSFWLAPETNVLLFWLWSRRKRVYVYYGV